MPEASAAADLTPAASRNNPLRGIGWLLLGILAFSIHDVAIKWVSGGYPISEVMLIRAAIALPLLLLVVRLDAGSFAALSTPWLGIVLVRGVIMVAGYIAYYLGFAAIPFAESVALYSTVPLFIVALAGPLLGERVGALSWIAVLAGFAGVLVMLQPGVGIFEPAAILIVLCALSYSVGMLMARRLGATIPASVMAFYVTVLFLVTGTFLGVLFTVLEMPMTGHASIDFLLRPMRTPTLQDLLIMGSCGLTAAVGVVGLTFAYREAEASLVASFEYSALVLAVIWGYLIWGEVPGTPTLMGAALIVGAGLVALSAGRWRRA
jgi:drug/metabolite transporter (DMT)-like permease